MLSLVIVQPFQFFTVEVDASDTIYVPGDFLTIQEAIDNATSGDTIIVSNGRYKENIVINKRLTIQGAHKSTTLIDGMQSGDTVIINEDDVIFTGFTVYNASDDGMWISSADNVTVESCNIRKNADGIYFSYSDYLTITNCAIYNCTYDGIYSSYSDYPTITTCTIYDCSDDGIHLSYSDYPTIVNCTIYDCSDDGIYAVRSHNVTFVNSEIYDTSDGITVSTSHDMLINGTDMHHNGRGFYCTGSMNLKMNGCKIFNNTGNEALYFETANKATLIDCQIYNNTSSNGIELDHCNAFTLVNSQIYDNDCRGIDMDLSDRCIIVNSTFYSNKGAGVDVYGSDFTLIYNCQFYNHTSWDGIVISGSDWCRVINCESNNNYEGLDVYISDITSICNSSFNNNYDEGIDIYGSLKTYITDSSFHNNSNEGIELDLSQAVVVNSNFSDNDRGIDLYDAILKARYCNFENNTYYGIFAGSLSNANVTQCWWGNDTGPYHSSLNPTSTGDRVSDYVDFDPWLSEPTQPDVLLSDLRCRVLRNPVNGTVYVPTGNIYDDSTFYAFYAVKEAPQRISAPTQSPSTDWLNPNGSPKFAGDIVTFGGRAANRMVAYYEDADLAKLGFQANGTHRIFKRLSDDYHVYASPTAGYNKTEKDYFAFQVYMDGDRTVLSLWGFAAEGTYAGGVCFIDVILPQLATFTDSYCVFSWTDMNADAKPQPNEIQLEAQGS